jgi:homoserine O-acetyltransferase
MTDIEEVYNPEPANVGIVHYEDFTFTEGETLKLENGASIGSLTLRYETYGVLNSNKSNAILIQHALSGNHHAAGKYNNDDKKTGWWDIMIGPGKAFDTDKYFIICSNCLGGCSGSTGPNSVNPETGKRYGTNFPVITIGDMVNAQVKLIDHLGIDTLLAIVGGSMGGMKAFQWSVAYPERVRYVIGIATTAAQNSQSIAFSEVGRQAIMQDPKWEKGNYDPADGPKSGLSVARMLAHITYLSDQSMRRKFGRKLQDKKDLDFTFDVEFEVESYLRHQGKSFIDRFDANSYLYISKALNYFDLAFEHGSVTKAFEKARAKYLIISFSSDWIYPPYMNKELVKAMLNAGRSVSYAEIETDCGHDAFLLEAGTLTKLVKAFLTKA